MDSCACWHDITKPFCFAVKLVFALLVDHSFLYLCICQIIFQHHQGKKPALWSCVGPPISALLNSKHVTGDFEHKEKIKSVF